MDLVVLAMYDYDVIIGMDLFSGQWANMDCYRKGIQFHPPDYPSYEFSGGRGNPSISLVLALEAYQLFEDGCQGYNHHNGQVKGGIKVRRHPHSTTVPRCLSKRITKITSGVRHRIFLLN